MKFTNKHNLPDYVVEWLTADDYDYEEGVYSITTLMKPAKAVYLERIHQDSLEMDCSDLIASRYGTSLHDSFEKLQLDYAIQEKRFYAELNNFKISGKMDLITMIIRNKLHDIKSTSVWKFVFKDYEDYIIQLSCYRWLLWKNGIEVAPEAQICMLFTDWKKSDARRDKNYPQLRCQVVDLELWDFDTTEAYINSRLVAFHSIVLNNLPECTSKELWQKESRWAVMKEGQKKAVKLYDNKEDIPELKAGQYIEERKSIAKRCGYCNARAFCEQAEALEKQGLLDG